MTSGADGSRFLLDTNVVLWLLLGERDRIGQSTTALLEDERHELLVSAASVWEVAVKRSIGKLDIEDRWAAALRQLDLTHLTITAEHAARVEHLPWHHRDPFDRLLVAQAQVERCTLVTADVRLHQYDVPIVSP